MLSDITNIRKGDIALLVLAGMCLGIFLGIGVGLSLGDVYVT